MLYQLSGFIDADKIHSDAFPALVADVSAGEHGIIALAFGKSYSLLKFLKKFRLSYMSYLHLILNFSSFFIWCVCVCGGGG